MYVWMVAGVEAVASEASVAVTRPVVNLMAERGGGLVGGELSW